MVCNTVLSAKVLCFFSRNISGTILKKMAFMELDETSGWNTAALLY